MRRSASTPIGDPERHSENRQRNQGYGPETVPFFTVPNLSHSTHPLHSERMPIERKVP
ncbi:hypothetical protein AH06_183 [Erwinia phage AH06]|nr:hypothetical protein AH06_183 [Erwinia phage AH06]